MGRLTNGFKEAVASVGQAAAEFGRELRHGKVDKSEERELLSCVRCGRQSEQEEQESWWVVQAFQCSSGQKKSHVLELCSGCLTSVLHFAGACGCKECEAAHAQQDGVDPETSA